MTKLAKTAGRYLREGFATGLADMVSVAVRPDTRPFPGTRRLAAEALRGDWERLGGDMRKAVTRVASNRGAK
jgi:hypothetical protein